MSIYTVVRWCAVMMVLVGCSTDLAMNELEQVNAPWSGKHVQTVLFGADDNSEVIKMLPSGNSAVMVASKSRKVTLLAVTQDGLKEVRSHKLFANDTSESELTHIDVDAQGEFGAITRTLPVVENGKQTDCKGSVVFVDLSDSANFGNILAEVAVGPMPDAVDISPDGRWVVTADEADYNDGKCAIASVIPSVTVLELPNGTPESVNLRASIAMVSDASGALREPEQVAIAADSNRVAVTLQDTHELLLFSIADVVGQEPLSFTTSDEAFKTVRLPNRSNGAEPWPDGVQHFQDTQGKSCFAVAGEYNDTLSFFSADGDFVKQLEISASDMPGDFPRNIEEWSQAPFRPDSMAAFVYGAHHYLAVSLKHAGAVGIWQVDALDSVTLVSAVKVGYDDAGTPLTESSIGTEGISAGPNGLVVTANEGESSVSLVAPLLQ